MNNAERLDWGGWGGRYELYKPDFSKQQKGTSGVPYEAETRPIWADAVDSLTPFVPAKFGRAYKPDTLHYHDNKATLWRWRQDFQNDFAARMDWTVMSYEEANHPPVPVLDKNTDITVKSGQTFSFDASGTYDPMATALVYCGFITKKQAVIKIAFLLFPKIILV